jgi:hypothetical protein
MEIIVLVKIYPPAGMQIHIWGKLMPPTASNALEL